jgi:hypothetical protein
VVSYPPIRPSSPPSPPTPYTGLPSHAPADTAFHTQAGVQVTGAPYRHFGDASPRGRVSLPRLAGGLLVETYDDATRRQEV